MPSYRRCNRARGEPLHTTSEELVRPAKTPPHYHFLHIPSLDSNLGLMSEAANLAHNPEKCTYDSFIAAAGPD
jgi:hypothetical protein